MQIPVQQRSITVRQIRHAHAVFGFATAQFESQILFSTSYGSSSATSFLPWMRPLFTPAVKPHSLEPLVTLAQARGGGGLQGCSPQTPPQSEI
jgi:hypothetical protein